MISCKIEEWNRQDAKLAERTKRLRENPLKLVFEPFSSLRPPGDLAVPFPAFLVRFATTLKSIMSLPFNPAISHS
jgi:hypothetical protein